jgi:hypothetical protein
MIAAREPGGASFASSFALQRAAKLAALAAGMESAIAAKINPSIGRQNPTARRARIAAGMRAEGWAMDETRRLLCALADAWSRGGAGVPDCLREVATKTGADSALHGYNTAPEVKAAAAAMLEPVSNEALTAREIADAERELIGARIPGFFVTPAPLAKMLVGIAGIRAGVDRVLEPSAGSGNIAEAICAAGAGVTCVEIQPRLCNILKLRGFDDVQNCDFMQFVPVRDYYSRVVMNPPFEHGQDCEHVRRAYDRLDTGGVLVSVMCEGPFFRSDRKSQEFIQWCLEVGAYAEPLPAGSFDGTITPTKVNTRMVVIEK